MQPLLARLSHRRTPFASAGMTLAEIMIVVVIIGILAAIAAPSFLHRLKQDRVADALERVRGALRETQQEAIKRSRTCALRIPEGKNPKITGDCLVTGDRHLQGVTLRHNHAPADPIWTVNFDYKGRNQNAGDQGTLILMATNDASVQAKCLVVSIGIGLLRTGNYNGMRTSILANNCDTP
jgi:prepilin-type N-terminal cleavage/methylation domain-containing protein